MEKLKPNKYFLRDDEQDYALLSKSKLPETDTPEVNQYGKLIKLVDETSKLAGKSLNINGDSSVSDTDVGKSQGASSTSIETDDAAGEQDHSSKDSD